MTLRIVFERADLQRVRLAGAPDPMWEVVLSLHRARERRPPAHLVGWHRHAHHRLRDSDVGGHWLRTLGMLVPPTGSFLDTLTPASPVTDLAAGCEAVASTPRRLLRSDLRAVFANRQAPGWVRRLAEGDRGQVGAVLTAFRGVHDLLVAPHWPQVQADVAAERTARVKTIAADGLARLLTGIPGVISWDGRVLKTRYPKPRTLHLAGRGLTLLPCYFCLRDPVTLVNSDLPPVLVHPIGVGGVAAPSLHASRHLMTLLGRTRAQCLATLGTPRTTSGLAASVGISVGAASKHAAVLRDAGLVTSRREGGSVVHAPTDLGSALIAGEVHDY